MSESVTGLWNSSVSGAYLLWRFTSAYCNIVPSGPNLLLAFPALALLTSSRLAEPIGHIDIMTFEQYVDHFLDSGATRKVKSLAGINGRIEERKEWILKSVEMAIVTDIIKLSPDTGNLTLGLYAEDKDMKRVAPKFKRDHGVRADKLGEWFATTTPEVITDFLGVKY